MSSNVKAEKADTEIINIAHLLSVIMPVEGQTQLELQLVVD